MAKQKLNDKWFRFVGIPVCAVLGHIIFFNGQEEEEGLGIFFLSMVEVLVLWETNRLVIGFFRNKYPDLPHTAERIRATLLWCLMVTILVRSLNILVYDIVEATGENLPFDVYVTNILIALFFVLLVAGMYEAIYYFRKWKESAVESEALKKENLQTQLHLLKVQINPHFLFNSLGSLDSLIDEDSKQAKIFLQHMSAVYRYLLQANETQLISLQEEMDFIQSYSDMLTTRFADGLQLCVSIEQHYLNWLLPPLTVQLLLENAVKHNAVLPSKPLKIQIHTANNYLVVENNIQLKTSLVASHKTGLTNIIAKYRLMQQPDVLIYKTGTHFRVEVPLIKNKDHAGINSRR